MFWIFELLPGLYLIQMYIVDIDTRDYLVFCPSQKGNPERYMYVVDRNYSAILATLQITSYVVGG